jgi:hypothetical protein
MRVAILGAGMSGMVAMKALDDMGINADIYDKCEPNVSQQKGLHYLHGDINLPLAPFKLKNLVIRPDNNVIDDNMLYSMKVWGNNSMLNNSLVSLPDETTVYDFVFAYEWLLDMYSGKITKMDIKKSLLCGLKAEYELVISTIPLFVLFPEYQCEYETVWASDVLPQDVELKDFTVVYNLISEVPWYRCSKVFGQVSTEYVSRHADSFPIKKIRTCDKVREDSARLLKEEHILLAGRFGEWNRKRLVHEIYSITQNGVKTLNQYGQTSISSIG